MDLFPCPAKPEKVFDRGFAGGVGDFGGFLFWGNQDNIFQLFDLLQYHHGSHA